MLKVDGVRQNFVFSMKLMGVMEVGRAGSGKDPDGELTDETSPEIDNS